MLLALGGVAMYGPLRGRATRGKDAKDHPSAAAEAEQTIEGAPRREEASRGRLTEMSRPRDGQMARTEENSPANRTYRRAFIARYGLDNLNGFRRGSAIWPSWDPISRDGETGKTPAGIIFLI